jgi:hypothetical protein
MNKSDLRVMLNKRAGELDYTYERFINGDTEYLIYPYERGQLVEGAPMRYRFTDKGVSK